LPSLAIENNNNGYTSRELPTYGLPKKLRYELRFEYTARKRTVFADEIRGTRMLNSAYKETRGRVISGSFRNSLGKSSESRQYRMLYARNPKNRGNSGEEMRIYANTLAVRDFSENIEVKQKRERERVRRNRLVVQRKNGRRNPSIIYYGRGVGVRGLCG